MNSMRVSHSNSHAVFKVCYMKRIVMLSLLLAIVFFRGMAQEGGIRFEQTKKWKEIVDKAKKEKKFIFVDCYTDWCGPCQVMAQTVFVADTVGFFFNQHFVNAKFEMEKDADGKMLKTKYGVEAYPTFLFVDPRTQEEVMRVLGGRTIDAMLFYASIALDPRENTAGLSQRYIAGEKGIDFLKAYYWRLESSYLPGKDELAFEFLNSADVDQLESDGGWGIFIRYVQDPLMKAFRLVMANRERFYVKFGQKAVDVKLENIIENAVEQLVRGYSSTGDVDHFRYSELIRYLKTVDDPMVPGALAHLYAAACVHVGDYAGLFRNIREVVKYNLFRKNGEKKYFAQYVPLFANCDDHSLIKEVVGLLDERCGQVQMFYEKADMMNFKADLQTKIGDLVGAEQSRKQETKFRAEGDDAGEWMNE